MNKIPSELQGPALRRRVRPRAVEPATPQLAQPRVPDRVQRWVQDGTGAWFMVAMIWLSLFYQVVPSELLEGRLPKLDDMLEPSILFRSIKLLLIGSSCAVIVWRAGLALLLLRSLNFLFICCMLLIAISFSWSIEPSATIARTVSLATIMLVCFAFVLVGWHPRRFQDALRPALTLLLVASVVVALLWPDLGIEQGDDASLKDAWRGVTHQKNSFGLLASFGTILWLHALITREKNAWMAVAGLILSAACVILSRSSSSLLSTALTGVLMAVLFFASNRLRRFMPYIVGGFATLILFYALAVLNVVPGLSALLAPVAELFGKDTTFSNRSLIWDIIKDHIRLHPVLGTGYGAYWIGPVPSSPSYEFLGRLNFYPTESHNGYLEMVNDLGFVGLAALLGYLIAFVRQSLQLMRIDRDQGVLYLCIFCQQAVANLSESYWLQAALGFTVLTLATFGTARALLGHRLEEYFGTPATGVAVHPR